MGDPFYAFTYLNEIKKSHSVEIIYFAEFLDDKEIKLNPEDHSVYLWVNENELSKITNSEKLDSDQEVLAIKKGFSLLMKINN